MPLVALAMHLPSILSFFSHYVVRSGGSYQEAKFLHLLSLLQHYHYDTITLGPFEMSNYRPISNLPFLSKILEEKKGEYKQFHN